MLPVVARGFNPETGVQHMLLSLVSIPNEKSETVTKELIKITTEKEIIKKVIGYGADNLNFGGVGRKLLKEIKNKIDEIRNRNWNRKLTQLKPSNQSLWQTSRFLKNKNQLMAPLKVNNQVLLTNIEKAEDIASQFNENHNNPLANNNTNFLCKINKEIDEIHSIPIDEPDFPTEEEIERIIKKLKNPKAPGFDRRRMRIY